MKSKEIRQYFVEDGGFKANIKEVNIA